MYPRNCSVDMKVSSSSSRVAFADVEVFLAAFILCPSFQAIALVPISPIIVRISRAIMSSSSVGMTQADGPAPRVIFGPPFSFVDESSSKPAHAAP